MDARHDRLRVEADVLHDVDLAARRPADLVDVRPEHPEGRPGAAPRGQLRPDLDLAVEELRAALGVEASRGVVVAHPALAAGLDDQRPVSRRARSRTARCSTASRRWRYSRSRGSTARGRGRRRRRTRPRRRGSSRPDRRSAWGTEPRARPPNRRRRRRRSRAGARKRAAGSRGRMDTGHLLGRAAGRRPGPSGGFYFLSFSRSRISVSSCTPRGAGPARRRPLPRSPRRAGR